MVFMKKYILFWSFISVNILLFSYCTNHKSNQNIPLQILLLRASQNKVNSSSGFLIKLPVTIGLNNISSNSSSGNNTILNNWDQIRQMPTFLKQVTDNIDNILAQFYVNGILGKTSISTQSTDNFKIKFNPAFNGVISSNAYSGTKTFRYSVEIWNITNNLKVLELFYDDAIQRTSGKGSLLTFQPSAFDSSINANLKVECYTITLDSQNTSMICSWVDGVFKVSGNVDNVMIKTNFNLISNSYNMQLLARSNPNQGYVCAGGNSDFYSLAAITNVINGKSLSVAKWGYNDNIIADTLCSNQNTLNYGYFDSTINSNVNNSSKYFVAQGISSDTNSYNTGSYPLLQDTSNLFSQIGTGTNELTIQRITTIILSFKGNADPGF